MDTGPFAGKVTGSKKLAIGTLFSPGEGLPAGTIESETEPAEAPTEPQDPKQ